MASNNKINRPAGLKTVLRAQSLLLPLGFLDGTPWLDFHQAWQLLPASVYERGVFLPNLPRKSNGRFSYVDHFWFHEVYWDEKKTDVVGVCQEYVQRGREAETFIVSFVCCVTLCAIIFFHVYVFFKGEPSPKRIRAKAKENAQQRNK